MILGDDVVIGDAKVARIYKDIITSIGVQISMIKTITRNSKYFSSEFASK